MSTNIEKTNFLEWFHSKNNNENTKKQKLYFIQTLFSSEKKVVLPLIKQELVSKETVEEALYKKQFLFSMSLHIESFGVYLSKETLFHLEKCDLETVKKFYDTYQSTFKKFKGSNKKWVPLFSGFPEEVMSASEAELYFHAAMHYEGDWSGVRYLPTQSNLIREKNTQKEFKLKIEGVPFDKALDSTFSWVNSTVTWTPAMVDVFKDSLLQLFPWEDLVDYLSVVKNKENKAIILGCALNDLSEGKVKKESIEWLKKDLNVTDLLRGVASFSAGDVSLADISWKFKKMSRPVRKFVLECLDLASQHPQALFDAQKNKRLWVRLGEVLHPGEHKEKFPSAMKLFSEVRLDKPNVKTWDARWNTALLNKDWKTVNDLINENPGNSARKTVHLLRVSPLKEHGLFLKEMKKNFDKISTQVLLALEEKLVNEVLSGKKNRVVMPKGQAFKRKRIEKPSAKVNPVSVDLFSDAIEKSLVKRFKDLPELGKVYIEKDLKDIYVPYGLRNASDSVLTLPRGSKVKVDAGLPVTRLFLWWSETNSKTGKKSDRIDVDLSAVGLDENFNIVQDCSFYSLKDSGLTHSGDFTSAPNGACEFIDVDESKLKAGTRYVLMMANSYSGVPYSQIPECFVGWMKRVDATKGETFDARTVQQKMDLTVDKNSIVPMIYDVQERKIIFLDAPMPRNTRTASSAYGALKELAEDFTSLEKPNLYRLFELHAKARANKFVGTPEEADAVFSVFDNDNQGLGVAATNFTSILTSWLVDKQDSVLEVKKDAEETLKIEQQNNVLDEWLNQKTKEKSKLKP